MRKAKTSRKPAKPPDVSVSGTPTYAELVASSIPVGHVPWLTDAEGSHAAGKAKRSQLEGRIPRRRDGSKPS